MSSDPGATIQVEVDLYSGRPNPTWTLPPEVAAALINQLASAPVAPGARLVDPGLGYRGLKFRLSTAAGPAEFKIFAGHLERQAVSETTVFNDADRRLERALIASAQGKIPSQVFEYLIQSVGSL